MNIEVINRLADISATDWNALVNEANPFLRHEFLATLEATHCVGGETGWHPQHIVIHDQGRLIGALPMYRKDHSYGEYVFDWAWASAYQRSGLNYYPKLVVGVPFTPVMGPRMLAAAETEHESIKRRLVEAATAHQSTCRASSLHWLFVTEDEARHLKAAGHLLRTGFQFHWQNSGFRDFDDFLSGFTAHKRKKIKRERRHVQEAEITMEVLTGTSIHPEHWDVFYDFYRSTIRAHGAIPYLTLDFFHQLGNAMRDHVVLVFAKRESMYVAGALNLRGHDALYGRYWGCHKAFHSLHFETCYYTPIDYCITQGLQRFEAGAQGGHKLARGFTPVITRSAHRLAHPQFNRAVADYLAREQLDVTAHVNELQEHIPFKKAQVIEG